MIDKLYTQKSGTTASGGATPPPPPGGAPPGGEPPMGLPESEKKDNMKILLESDNFLDEESFIDLSKARNYLGEIEKHLSKLIDD
jgi:hypothetical protein